MCSGTLIDHVWYCDHCHRSRRPSSSFPHRRYRRSGRPLQKYQQAVRFVVQGNWFVRIERASLKNGEDGIRPYDSLENVIKSLVSINPGHKYFSDADETLTLYLRPFRHNLHIMKEFRLFVYRGALTGISSVSKRWRVPNRWLTALDQQRLLEQTVRTKLVDAYEAEFNPRMRVILIRTRWT